MLGIKTIPENRIVVEKLREFGLLTASANDNVVRVLPPLIIKPKHVNEAMAIMEAAFVELGK